MKALTKIIVAASLGLSVVAAQAALIETDYPGSFITTSSVQKSAPALVVEYKGVAPFTFLNNQAGLVPNPAYKAPTMRTVAEVRREARMLHGNGNFGYDFVNG